MRWRLQTDDNQSDQHYKPDNHRGGEGRDQPPQKLQIGRFLDCGIAGIIAHVAAFCHSGGDLGRATSAS